MKEAGYDPTAFERPRGDNWRRISQRETDKAIRKDRKLDEGVEPEVRRVGFTSNELTPEYAEEEAVLNKANKPVITARIKEVEKKYLRAHHVLVGDVRRVDRRSRKKIGSGLSEGSEEMGTAPEELLEKREKPTADDLLEMQMNDDDARKDRRAKEKAVDWRPYNSSSGLSQQVYIANEKGKGKFVDVKVPEHGEYSNGPYLEEELYKQIPSAAEEEIEEKIIVPEIDESEVVGAKTIVEGDEVKQAMQKGVSRKVKTPELKTHHDKELHRTERKFGVHPYVEHVFATKAEAMAEVAIRAKDRQEVQMTVDEVGAWDEKFYKLDLSALQKFLKKSQESQEKIRNFARSDLSDVKDKEYVNSAQAEFDLGNVLGRAPTYEEIQNVIMITRTEHHPAGYYIVSRAQRHSYPDSDRHGRERIIDADSGKDVSVPKKQGLRKIARHDAVEMEEIGLSVDEDFGVERKHQRRILAEEEEGARNDDDHIDQIIDDAEAREDSLTSSERKYAKDVERSNNEQVAEDNRARNFSRSVSEARSENALRRAWDSLKNILTGKRIEAEKSDEDDRKAEIAKAKAREEFERISKTVEKLDFPIKYITPVDDKHHFLPVYVLDDNGARALIKPVFKDYDLHGMAVPFVPKDGKLTEEEKGAQVISKRILADNTPGIERIYHGDILKEVLGEEKLRSGRKVINLADERRKRDSDSYGRRIVELNPEEIRIKGRDEKL